MRLVSCCFFAADVLQWLSLRYEIGCCVMYGNMEKRVAKFLRRNGAVFVGFLKEVRLEMVCEHSNKREKIEKTRCELWKFIVVLKDTVSFKTCIAKKSLFAMTQVPVSLLTSKLSLSWNKLYHKFLLEPQNKFNNIKTVLFAVHRKFI